MPDTGPQTALVYVHRPIRWEYRLVTCRLDLKQALGEAGLNALGAEGWELASVAAIGETLHYYFKRSVD